MSVIDCDTELIIAVGNYLLFLLAVMKGYFFRLTQKKMSVSLAISNIDLSPYFFPFNLHI